MTGAVGGGAGAPRSAAAAPRAGAPRSAPAPRAATGTRTAPAPRPAAAGAASVRTAPARSVPQRAAAPQRTTAARTQQQRTPAARTQQQRTAAPRTQQQRTAAPRPQQQRTVVRPRRVPPAPPAVRTPLAPAHPHRRQRMLLAAIVLVLLTFVARLVYVQGLDTGALADVAYNNRLLTVEIPAVRGEILDADGVVLATSVERYDLVANQLQVADWKDGVDAVVDAAALLSPLVGTPAPELGAALLGDDPYVIIARDLAPDVYRQVMDLGIAGISGERTTERVYPGGTTAGNVVGFLGHPDPSTDVVAGVAGIEQVYEEVLSGTAGSETYEQGARGQRIPTGDDDVVAAVQGRDVQLTIDRDLQYVAQSAADEAYWTHGAQWVTVEVLDVTTGEILALADSGTVDPNDPANADPSRAAAVVYEPGSTAKVIAMAAILEQGIATPTSQYVVPYQYAVPNGEVFKDSHEHGDLNLTLTGILSESSNTGTVMVGQNLPPQVRLDYLARFGLGTSTGSGLPGESAGLLRTLEDWTGDGRSPYTVLFGQAVSVTTLQSTQVFATLANGGVRVAPHLVAAVADETGAMVPVEQPAPVQVVSAETADTVVRMLESAVVEGTGGNAAVPGYRVAGKTGTSQSFEGNGVVKNVASFVGIAPADAPRIAVNVAIYDPKTSIYGGATAAPVFAEVTAYALQHLGVPPSGAVAELFPTTWQ